MKEYLKLEIKKLILFISLCVLSSLLNVGVAVILEYVIDSAVSGTLTLLKKISLSGILYIFILSIVYYLNNITKNSLINSILFRIRNDIFDGIYSLDYEKYKKNDTSAYISVILNDVNILEESYLKPIMNIFQNSFIFVFTFILLLQYSGVITIWLTIMLIISLIVPNMIGKFMRKRQYSYSKQIKNFTQIIRDFFAGFELIMSSNILNIVIEKFFGENKSTIIKKNKRDNIEALSDSISCLFASFLQISIIVIGGFLVFNGQITIGVTTALIQLCSMFTTPISSIVHDVSIIQSTKPIQDRVVTFKNEYGLKQPYKYNKKMKCFQTIQLINCFFKYPEKDQYCLQNVNISILHGYHYLILGKNGSGKSTLIRLISGYYNNYSGTIFFNGRDIKTIDRQLIFDTIAIVHQNTFLFNATVLDNITMFRDYEENDLKQALDLSGVSLFLDSLPNGINSYVGENAFNLSGGQRQRLAVARALLQKKQVFILDEGISAIDRETAFSIEKNILQIPELTVITITHNLQSSLKKYYDIIFHIDDLGNVYKENINNIFD